MSLALALLALAATPVQIEPPTLQLGPGPDAAIVLVVPGAKSVTVFPANGVGAVSAPQSLGDGRFRARFTFPKERFPQLALFRLEVEAEGGARSRQWVALPLIANADLKIETRPLAAVTVTIGDKTFGPQTADARGKVTIAARVPPGFPTAELLAVDRAGNKTARPLDLLTRPYPRTAAALTGAVATPDQPIPVEIFAVEPDGRPLANAAALRLSAKLGSFDAPVARADGVFIANYASPRSVTAAKDAVSIGVEGSPLVTELEVKLQAGALAQVVISLTPPAHVAGSGIPTAVQAKAVDANLNELSLEGPVFTSDFGQLETTAAGAVLRVPDAYAGRSHARIRVTANATTAEVKLPLLGGQPVRAELTFPSRVAAGQTVQGQLFVVDAFGNPVERAAVAATVTTGRVAAITEAGGGRYDVKLTTEPGDPAGDHALQLTANGRPVGRTALAVLRYQRRWAITVGAIGFVQSNFSQWVSGGPRLNLGLRVGGTPLDLVVEGVFGAYTPITARAATGGPPAFTVTLEQYSFLAGARYWIPYGVRTAFHLSLIAGFQRTSSVVSRSGVPGSVRDQSSSIAARIAGGAGFHLGFGKVLVQLEYTVAPTGGVVQGNAAGAGLAVGYLASF